MLAMFKDLPQVSKLQRLIVISLIKAECCQHPYLHLKFPMLGQLHNKIQRPGNLITYKN